MKCFLSRLPKKNIALLLQLFLQELGKVEKELVRNLRKVVRMCTVATVPFKATKSSSLSILNEAIEKWPL